MWLSTDDKDGAYRKANSSICFNVSGVGAGDPWAGGCGGYGVVARHVSKGCLQQLWRGLLLYIVCACTGWQTACGASLSLQLLQRQNTRQGLHLQTTTTGQF